MNPEVLVVHGQNSMALESQGMDPITNTSDSSVIVAYLGDGPCSSDFTITLPYHVLVSAGAGRLTLCSHSTSCVLLHGANSPAKPAFTNLVSFRRFGLQLP